MTRHDLARKLVRHHVDADTDLVRAVRYERSSGDAQDEPIKLLEVNAATVPAGVVPVYFGPSKEFPPIVIIELTEEEFERLERGELALPDGWDEPTLLHPKAA